jgi:Tfp pilus assembly protein PilO
MALNLQTGYHRYRRYFLDISLLYKKKKVRVYTEIVLSLLTISFFLVFAIKPTLTTIAGLIKTIQDQKLVSETLAEKINALRQAQTEYNLITDDIYLVDEALPKDTQISLLVKQLEALARRSGITIETTKFDQVWIKGASPTKEKETSQSVNFSFVASGEYQNLKLFLNSLSSLRRITLVESFAFKTGKTEEGSLLSLSLNGKAYFMGEE